MDYHAAKLRKKFLTRYLFLTFIPNPPSRLRLGVAQLVEGVVDGFYLHGNLQVGLLLLLVDVVLVVQDFLHIGIQLFYLMRELLVAQF